MADIYFTSEVFQRLHGGWTVLKGPRVADRNHEYEIMDSFPTKESAQAHAADLNSWDRMQKWLQTPLNWEAPLG